MIEIKIIQNNVVKEKSRTEKIPKIEFPYETICENCDSELSIDEEDLHIGWLGYMSFTCPCCGEESMEYDFDGITLTVENIKFPNHFHRINKNMRRVAEMDKNDIIDGVKKSILHLRKNKNEFAVVSGYGDTRIHVYRYDREEMYEVLVSKDTYQTEVQFEDVDFLEGEND